MRLQFSETISSEETMRILLTGHEGFIGSVLGPNLRAEGHDVIGVDSGFFRSCTFGAEPARGPIAGRQKDIRSLEPADLSRFDAVVHLAALSNDPLGDLDEALTIAINHSATVRLARLAREAGVGRFLFASSCSNYGAAGESLVDEESELDPLTAYGRSKVAAEKDLRMLAGSEFSPVLLRCATAYGVSPRLRLDLVVNNLVASAITTGAVRLLSDGSAWRPLIHVEDIGRAFSAVLAAPRAAVHNEVFNVGAAAENYRIRDVAALVAECVPDSKIEIAAGASADARCFRVDCSKLSRTLGGFKLEWTVARGARALCKAYLDRGLTLDDFVGPRYKRVARVRELLDAGLIDETLCWTSAE